MDPSTFCQRAVAFLRPWPRTQGVATAEVARPFPIGWQPVEQALPDGLVVRYAVEHDSGYALVGREQMVRAGLDQAGLHAIGVTNLARAAEDRLSVQPYGPVYTLFFDGNFEASLLLVDQLWEGKLRDKVAGDFAVAVPARDIIAFCDASSREGLTELRHIITRVQRGGDHLVSTRIFRRKGKAWFALTEHLPTESLERGDG